MKLCTRYVNVHLIFIGDAIELLLLHFSPSELSMNLFVWCYSLFGHLKAYECPSSSSRVLVKTIIRDAGAHAFTNFKMRETLNLKKKCLLGGDDIVERKPVFFFFLVIWSRVCRPLRRNMRSVLTHSKS